MIKRIWYGTAANSAAADQYIKHLSEEAFPKIRSIDGNIAAKALKRAIGDTIEFAVVTTWDSMDAIKAFSTGENIETAVVAPDARAALSHYDDKVSHFEVVDV